MSGLVSVSPSQRRGEKKEEDRRKMEEKVELRDWGPNVLGCRVPGAQIDE